MFFLIFVFLSALVLAIRRLKYGIYLIKENPNQSLKVYETIENIAIVDRYAPHKYKVKIIEDDRIYAHWITISGVNYYLMFRKNLQIGDKVEITYLPKSKIVLEVNIIETE